MLYIKIFNFIGTPNAIQFNDKNMTFEKAKTTFLDNLKNINFGLRCTFQGSIEDQDTLLTFFHDKDYVENSDFVVKTSEIIRDEKIIEQIKYHRDRFQVYQSEGMTFFVSPNIIHLGKIFNLDRFEQDLNDRNLRAQLSQALFPSKKR